MKILHLPTCDLCGNDAKEGMDFEKVRGADLWVCPQCPHAGIAGTLSACDDCGAEPGEEHSPKCTVVIDHYADMAHESMKDDWIELQP